MRTMVWFRGKDLRLSDHAPLTDAVEAGEVIPLFVLDPYFFAPRRAQNLPHRIQFLLDSLSVLAEGLSARGTRLLVVPGKSVDVIPRLVDAWQVERVVAHRWVEPLGRERDGRIQRAIGDRLHLYEGELLPYRRGEGALPEAPHRRGLGQQQPRVAVVGGVRRRRPALVPGVQPGEPGAAVRSPRGLRPSLGA